MIGKNILAIILGCALGLASITTALAGDKDAVHGKAKPKAQGKLHLVTLGELATNIDLGESGNSPGDVAVYVRPLLNKDRTEEVGTGAGRCTILRVGQAEDWLAECAITHVLELMVEGLVRPRVAETSVLAVVGGTGIYRKVRGELFDTPIVGASGRPEAFELVFDLEH